MKKKALLFALLLLSAVNAGEIFWRSEYVMGTLLELQLPPGSEPAAEAFLATIRRMDATFSHFREDSELKKLEKASGKWVRVSDPLFQLFEVSYHFFVLSHGLFDVSLGPVLELWRERKTAPFDFLLARARSGFYFVQMREKDQAIRLLKSEMRFDFGGIGKGFAVDIGLKELKKRGVRKGLINFGGQVTALESLHGQSFQVTIRGEPITCWLRNISLCVSSNEQKEEGHIYHPERREIMKSSRRLSLAFSPSATVCDALSTIGFLDEKVGMEVARQFPGSFLSVRDSGGFHRLPPFCREN